MNIFLDTNVLLDYILNRKPHADKTTQIFSMQGNNNTQLFVSSLSFSNMAYILRKDIPHDELYSIFLALIGVTQITTVGDQEVLKAVHLQARDFEDALQYYSALSVGTDCIVTRNKKDYTFAEIPVMTPSEFLETEWP